MKEFYGNSWQKILDENDLMGFDALWDLKADWFDKLNHDRGGWSGVCRIKVTLADGGEVGVFLKRQENHITKTITRPSKGIPTFQREFRNIQSFINKGLPTVEPIYFARRMHEGNLQAILMTRELEGYQSLEKESFCSGGEIMSDKAERVAILTSLASVIRSMHSHHLQHTCLYPKHVFVKKEGNDWDIRLIDLETVRWKLFKRSAILRDFGTLHRYGALYQQGLSDRLLFIKAYMREAKLSEYSKSIWRAIGQNALSKKKAKYG